jgi:hypothetical protein
MVLRAHLSHTLFTSTRTFVKRELLHMFPSTWTLESETNFQNSRIILDLPTAAFLDISSRLKNFRRFE